MIYRIHIPEDEHLLDVNYRMYTFFGPGLLFDEISISSIFDNKIFPYKFIVKNAMSAMQIIKDYPLYKWGLHCNPYAHGVLLKNSTDAALAKLIIK